MKKNLHEKLINLKAGDNLFITECPYCGVGKVNTIVEETILEAYEDEDGYDHIVYVSSFENHNCISKLIISEYYYRYLGEDGLINAGMEEIQDFIIFKKNDNIPIIDNYIKNIKNLIDEEYIISDGNVVIEIQALEKVYNALIEYRENSIDDNYINTYVPTKQEFSNRKLDFNSISEKFNNYVQSSENITKFVIAASKIFNITLE